MLETTNKNMNEVNNRPLSNNINNNLEAENLEDKKNSNPNKSLNNELNNDQKDNGFSTRYFSHSLSDVEIEKTIINLTEGNIDDSNNQSCNSLKNQKRNSLTNFEFYKKFSTGINLNKHILEKNKRYKEDIRHLSLEKDVFRKEKEREKSAIFISNEINNANNNNNLNISKNLQENLIDLEFELYLNKENANGVNENNENISKDFAESEIEKENEKSNINSNENYEEYNYNPKDDYLLENNSYKEIRIKKKSPSMCIDKETYFNDISLIKPHGYISEKDKKFAKEEINTKKNSKRKNSFKFPSGMLYDSELPMGREIYKKMLVELEENFKKELIENQIDIINIHVNRGKFTTEIFPNVLNNIHPKGRFKAFKIIIENLYEWPENESYFNKVISLLPTNNHESAVRIIKNRKRANDCCTIF